MKNKNGLTARLGAKAFTLTELLVVVILIGILAVVVLPKFSKVFETRKTTEAESVMAAVRTEQERRCALDKPYTNDAEKLEGLLPSTSRHYTYTLDNTGMLATSKGNYSYALKMPSYEDGRICCEGAECDKLNKDYPTCTSLTASSDYAAGTECSANVEPASLVCLEGEANQSCGCGGMQTRVCDGATGNWGPWGACSRPANECTGNQMELSGDGTKIRMCSGGCWGGWQNVQQLGCSEEGKIEYRYYNDDYACTDLVQWRICETQGYMLQWSGWYDSGNNCPDPEDQENCTRTSGLFAARYGSVASCSPVVPSEYNDDYNDTACDWRDGTNVQSDWLASVPYNGQMVCGQANKGATRKIYNTCYNFMNFDDTPSVPLSPTVTDIHSCHSGDPDFAHPDGLHKCPSDRSTPYQCFYRTYTCVCDY